MTSPATPATFTPRPFEVHSGLFDAVITPENLTTILTNAKAWGADSFELICHPGLLKATPEEVANASLAAQLPITTLCIFHGEGDPDPLEGKGQSALDRISDACRLGNHIGEATGRTPSIDGPWAWNLAKRYPRTDITWGKVFEFGRRAGQIVERARLKADLECLRPPENFALQGHQRFFDALIAIRTTAMMVGAHVDSFHFDAWGDDPQLLVDNAELLGHFHASGSLRHTPGHDEDRVGWQKIAAALIQANYKGRICFEGFGPVFRETVSAIGGQFPADLDTEASIRLAKKTLANLGLVAA